MHAALFRSVFVKKPDCGSGRIDGNRVLWYSFLTEKEAGKIYG